LPVTTGPVPEEGVSRLITQQTNERRDHYVRYGLAFILEHGFMRTEKGRTCYKANLEQIRNAVLESMHIGVIEALLKAKQFSHAWTKRYGQASRSGSALRGVLGEEVEMYATIQKNEHGFDLVRLRLQPAFATARPNVFPSCYSSTRAARSSCAPTACSRTPGCCPRARWCT
jgi:hypothetical protein